MKKMIGIFVLGVYVTCATYAQALTAYEIAKKHDEMNQATTASYSATMTLTDKRGKSRVREVLMRKKDYGETEKTVISFITPKDVQGVGYLSFSYDEKSDGSKPDDDNWLYMPALKKVRRISGSDSDGDFMGTDFTYDDMGDRGLNEDEYTLLGEESVNGSLCYKLQALSKDKTEKNPQRILYIEKQNFLLYRCEFYDRQNNLQRILDCTDIEQIDGYWTAKMMVMKNVQTNHSTVMELKDVIYDKQIDDSVFTVASIERGKIR